MAEEAIFAEVEGTFIGIDLGTSNSVVTYFKNSKFEQVKFKSKKIIPSALFYRTKDDIIFGEQALKRGVSNPDFLIKEFKRDLGTNEKYRITFIDENISNTDNKIYIIDTNIFINEPLILDSFSKYDSIKLANTVIGELQNLANKDDVELNAKMALEKIEKMKSKLDISFEESDLDLLPEDLTVNTANDDNDNRILSIAKFFSDEDNNQTTILLTNDNGLKLKAESNAVSVMTFSEFNSYKSNLENQTKSDIVTITPKEASRKFLQHIKTDSEKYLNEDITKAVITVPANFNPVQIGLVKEAGEEAGFEEIAIQKEPIAVGFAYAFAENDKDKTILVYDFGGGTFDASFLKIRYKKINNEIEVDKIEVIETDGDNKLGGKDITKKVVEMIFDEIDNIFDLDMYDQANSGLSLSDFNNNLNQIENEAERVKIALSEHSNEDISIPNLIGSDGLFNLEFNITRKAFEDEILDIRKKSIDTVKNLINNSGINVDEIDEIVMAGGSSLIPSIRESLRDTLGKEPKSTIDSSVVISQGATIEAILKWSDKIDPDKFKKHIPDALHDFGIGIRNNNFDVLIPKGTSLPFCETRKYSTEVDNQKIISIKTFQRKSVYSTAKKIYDDGINFVDEIIIDEIPPSLIGELVIKVDFELTKNDVLEVNVEISNSNGDIIKSGNKIVSEASK